MLIIDCPWCGPREQTEFSCGGEAHIVRPIDTDALTDEQWVHAHGCRRWFNVQRDTVTCQITAVYKVGEKPPGTRA